MGDLQLIESKSGKKSCSVGGIRLHSSYDPVKEAQRFVSNLDVGFNPSLIVITEPALSYCASFFRQRFPKSLLIAIRFSNYFDEYNHLWDKVIYFNQVPHLLDCYGEDKILATGFFSWQPSQQAFPKEFEKCWDSIRTLVTTSRDILGTRAYFGKRWVKNSIGFCAKLTKTYTVQKGNTPILLTASGSSLESSIDYIKRYRTSFFLIALSSSLSPLVYAGIKPDLCISTDGGYWAKKHTNTYSIPLMASAEAAIPSKCFEQPIIPLQYGDGPESDLLKTCSITALPAMRNGTVSGTALELAFSLTTGPVFACGLDLSCKKGFQHTQPNALEESNSPLDTRIFPKETRVFPQQQSSQSIEIYRQWFSNKSSLFAPRFYRLGDANYTFSNSLGEIQDINWEKFYSIITNWEKSQNKMQFPSLELSQVSPKKTRLKLLQKKLQLYKNTGLPENWLSTIAPAEQALWQRSIDKTELQSKIQEKTQEFLDDMIAYLYQLGEQS